MTNAKLTRRKLCIRRRRCWYQHPQSGGVMVLLRWRSKRSSPAWPPPPDWRPGRLRFGHADGQELRGQGLTLAKLFDAQVAQEPVLRRLIGEASGHWFSGGLYRSEASEILARRYREDLPLWPAVLDGFDLFVDWLDFPFQRFANRPANERAGLLDHLHESEQGGIEALRLVRGAANLVRCRYEAMMSLLRAGELEAYGHAAGGRAVERISPAEWSAPSLRIDFNEGHVGRSRSPGAMDAMEVVWTGVVVKQTAPVPTEISKPDGPRGGAPTKYPWGAAFDYLMLYLSQQGMPESGQALVDTMCGCLIKAGYKEPNAESVRQKLINEHRIIWNAAVEETENLQRLSKEIFDLGRSPKTKAKRSRSQRS